MIEGPSVLVFERDSGSRQRLLAHLSSVDVRIMEASSTEDALELCKSVSPEVLIASIADQATEGASRRKIISADRPEVMEAIISESFDEELLRVSIDSGATEIIKKPVTVARIRDSLSRLSFFAERKRVGSFEPGTISRAEFDLELSSRGEAIAPTIKMILGVVKVFVHPKDLLRFELALDEVLRNAYEHGNLGIGSQEKQELCEADKFEIVLKEREAQAVRSGMAIYVNVKCTPEEVCCIIEDQGDGFDWRSGVDVPVSEESLTSLHGRGLILIRSVFDTVAFNEKGNKVTLVKKLFP